MIIPGNFVVTSQVPESIALTNPMKKIRLSLLLVIASVFFFSACSSDDDVSSPSEQESDGDAGDSDENGELGGTGDEPTVEVDSVSLAPNGCQNVVILGEFAYAACETGIEIVDLISLERNFVSIPADDITGDAGLGVLFVQSGSSVTQLDLVDPLAPNAINTVNTNFSLFSGISAASGVLVVSAGSGGSNTEVYTYDANSLSLSISGIAQVDSQTGNPDVHVAQTTDGVLAFYSQDLGLVANWGIQIVEFDTDGNIVEIPEVVVLTPGPFTGGFGVPFAPANIPVESEFLNEQLYVAHFAANGLEVIDLSASDEPSVIPLGYEPTNVATDGSQLFVVSVDRSIVDTVDPITETVIESLSLPLQQAVGVAANLTHIAVADRSAGLIIAVR